MRFHQTGQLPPYGAELVCRQSAAVSFFGAFVILGLLGAVPLWLWFSGSLPIPIAIAIALLGLLIVPMIASSVWGTLLRSNWILAIGSDGLWLNLRSYQNYRAAAGSTVVHFPFQEIACAQKHVARRSEESSDGTLRWKEQMLDLRLAHEDGSQLRRAIADERTRKTTRRLLGGITVTEQVRHVTIGVPEPGLIRIVWRSRYDFVRPGLRHVLQRLAKHIDVHEPQRQADEDWHELSDEQVDSRVLELVERGDRIAAIKLLKLRRGYSLTKAKTFVDELTGRLTTV